MGKQSKRKNKQRRGGGGSSGSSRHRPTGLADDPFSSTPETDATSSAAVSSNNGPAAKIILKIRHGDPRVRHASLVALSRTLYDATSLENAASKRKVAQRDMAIVGGNHKNKKDISAGKSTASSGAAEACNPTLLRALSERILDVDIPCATIAVGCLSNYISFYYGCGDGEDIQSRHRDEKNKNKKNRGTDSVRVLDEGYDDEDVVASDVMVPILLQRIQNSSATLQSMSANHRTIDDNTRKKLKDFSDNGGSNSCSSSINGTAEKYKLKMQEQWSLLSLTIDALAGLIENCPRAVHRLSSCSSNIIAQLLDVSKLSCTPPALESSMDTAINALRALHSLLDDNLSLITSITISPSPSVDQGSITSTTTTSSSPLSLTLHNITSQLESLVSDDALLPILARLHACGSLLALRSVYLQQMMVAGQQQHPPPLTSTPHQQHHFLEAAIERVQTSTEQFVLPFLYSFFEKYAIENDMESPPTNMKTTTQFLLLVQKMMSLSKQLSEIKNDESVEMQVVSQVNARAEPARMIARRQKEMKLNSNIVTDGSIIMEEKEEEEMVEEVGEKQSIKQKDGQNDDIDAVMALDDDENITNQQQQKQQAEDDLRDDLDKVVSEWKDVVGTQKLALELLANLTSGREAEDDDEYEGEEDDDDDDDDDDGMMYAGDDDEHMWDSDDEAKLMLSSAKSAQRQAGGAVTTHMNIAAYEQVIYNSMMNAQHNLPIMLLHYFCYWVEFLPNAVTIAATTPTTTYGTDTGDADMKDVPKATVRLPNLVSHDVDEILSTCALCLGNVVACNLLEGVAGVNEQKNTTDIFFRQVVSLLNGSAASSTSNIAIGNVACKNEERGEYRQSIRSGHQQHVTSVLLSLLERYQPKSHVLMDTLTLNHLISILLSQRQHESKDLAVVASEMIIPDDDDDHAESTLQTHRNIISMLGVLCTNSEMPLPETTDRKVCRALLSRLALGITACDGAQVINDRTNEQQRVQQGTAMRKLVDSVVIAHEVFNVLMDMYGHDDCHERVFSEECVLDQLRKSLPWFKRSVKKVVAATATTSVSSLSNRWEKMKIDLVKEDECVWNETALNATRFIKYKQDMKRR